MLLTEKPCNDCKNDTWNQLQNKRVYSNIHPVEQSIIIKNFNRIMNFHKNKFCIIHKCLISETKNYWKQNF